MNVKRGLALLKTMGGIAHGSRAFTGPLQANLNVTNRCNLRCIHCYFYSPHIERPNLFEVRRARRAGEALPDLQMLKDLQKMEADGPRTHAVIAQLLASGTRRFQFGGNGEPFLHSEAIAFMRRVKEGGGTCITNTNGTLLTPPRMDELLAMGFDDLRVTTMAGTARAYSRTHSNCPEAVFERLRESLLHLAERKHVLATRRPRLTLVCIIVGENCDGLVDFARFAAEVEAEQVIFRLFDDVSDPGFAGLIPTAEQAALARTQLAEARLRLEARGIAHNVENALQVFRKKLDTTELYKVIPCYYGWLAIRVDLDGEVYPCCRCYGSMGNIFRQDFQQIWNSEAYRQWRAAAAAINRRGTPLEGCECGSCVHHGANLRVYKALHPLLGRSRRLAELSPEGPADPDV